MTVGELVAYLDADDRGFDSGLDRAERRLHRLDAITTSTTGSIESKISRGFARVADSIGNGLDPDAALKDLSRLLDGVEQAMGDAERRAGDGGRRAGSAFGGELVGVAQKSAGLVGSAFDGALSKIGDLGPAKVAGLVAAIAALPAVANVAAAGIVSAIGGGLLAVGFTAAASADDVQDAWKQAVAEIKSELADAAQPLEGSAIRAAAVAERVFDRLKPSLKRIFRDLVPDVDRFVEMVGQGVSSLGPTLEKIGDSFGNVLSELGNRMPAIIQNISGALDTFTQILDEDPQMLADLVEDATELLKVGAEVLTWADEIKTAFMAPFGPAGSQQGTDYFFRQIFGQSPEEIEQGMAQIPILLAQMQTQAAAGAAAISRVGDDADNSADGVRNLNAALEEFFEPAQSALSASNDWSRALKEAHDELKKGNPSLLDRRMQLENLLGALAKKAQTERESTGAVKDSTKAFEANAGMLAALAGKSTEGAQALVGLATSLGYTVERTKNGIVVTDEFGKTVARLPNNKNVKVDADTDAAKKRLEDTKKAVDDVKGKDVKINADVKKALDEVAKVTSKLKGLQGEGQQAGANLGSGLVSGIRSMIGQAAAAAQSLAKSALDAAKNFLGIHSPSTVMAEVGKWTVRGLIQGLTEEEGKAVDTVKRMVEQIKSAFASTPDTKDHLIAFVTKGNDSLAALAKQRDELVKQLAEAKEKAKAIAGDAKEWASITGLSEEELNSGNFADALKTRAQTIKDFANNIKELARRGLNKETLRQIIDAGVEGGASLAEMLVGADGSEIKAINRAQKQIDNMSKQLGKTGADALYDTGKKAGEGYLKGLQDSLKKIDKLMTSIVQALVKAIKKELKIKSPSRVMMEIGEQTIEGLALGITDSTSDAVDAIQGVAASVANAASTSLPGGGSAAGAVPGQAPASPGTGVTYAGAPGTGVAMPSAAEVAAARPGGVNVNIDMSGGTFREEADVARIGRDVGFEFLARPF